MDKLIRAHLDCFYHRISISEAQAIIENSTSGDIAWAAYLMCEYLGSSKEWADKMKEKYWSTFTLIKWDLE
jgi:hypothetical protein